MEGKREKPKPECNVFCTWGALSRSPWVWCVIQTRWVLQGARQRACCRRDAFSVLVRRTSRRLGDLKEHLPGPQLRVWRGLEGRGSAERPEEVSAPTFYPEFLSHTRPCCILCSPPPAFFHLSPHLPPNVFLCRRLYVNRC